MFITSKKTSTAAKNNTCLDTKNHDNNGKRIEDTGEDNYQEKKEAKEEEAEENAICVEAEDEVNVNHQHQMSEEIKSWRGSSSK